MPFQTSSPIEVIDLLLKITKRCFSKIIVAVSFNSTNQDESGRIQTNLEGSGRIPTSPDLSEVERNGLSGLLQLLGSVYVPKIWKILSVVVFHDMNFGMIK